MSIKIPEMNDLEIESYIKQCEQINFDKRLDALVLLDPSHDIAVNVKTLLYRLKEERLMRSIKDLDAAWEDRLSNVEFDPFLPEEMEIAYPELKKYLDSKEKAEAEAEAEEQAKIDSAGDAAKKF